jgi:hypothetical protein
MQYNLAMAQPVSVYLEVGTKRTFAGAIEWPGWCRSGRTEDEALEVLVAYAGRYKKVIGSRPMKFSVPKDAAALKVVERLKGGSGTDFGVPGESPDADDRPISANELKRLQDLLKATWAAFDRASKATEDVELTKGPRGGGRDLDKMIGHVLDAEKAYLGMLGSRSPKGSFDDVMAEMRAVRATAQDVLVARVRGQPIADPRATQRPWLPRYFVRRSAWHALDHTWELEDRSSPS